MAPRKYSNINYHYYYHWSFEVSSLRDTDTSHGSWVISIRSTRKPSPTPFSSVHTVRQSQLQEHSWPKQNTGKFFACLSAFDSAIPQRQKHGSSFRASQDALQARHTSTDWVVRWGHYRIQGWWSWNGTWRSSKSRSSLTDGQIKALREHSGSQNNSCLITAQFSILVPHIQVNRLSGALSSP